MRQIGTGGFWKLTCIFLALVNINTVRAQSLNQSSIKLGEADLFPSVRLEYTSTNNPYRSSQPSEDATGLLVAPTAVLVANRRGIAIEAGYSGAFGSFDKSELNFDDHLVFGSVDAILGNRKRASAEASIAAAHQDFGTFLTSGGGAAGPGSEQVEFIESSVSGSFTYGAASARINLSGGVDIGSRDYQNRGDVTAGRDYFEITPFGQASYRLSSDTRALLEVRFSNLDFDSNQLDRTELQLLTGILMRGSGKSGGSAKIGVSQTNYSDSSVQDRSVLAADVGLYLLPTENSRIDLKYSRQFNNEDLINFSVSGSSQTIDDIVSVTWNNEWSGFVKSKVGLDIVNQNRDCPSIGSQTITGGLEVSLSPLRWMEIGVGFSSTTFTEEDCGSEDQEKSDYDLQKVAVFTRIFL